jgi:signal transduction histidine kinase
MAANPTLTLRGGAMSEDWNAETPRRRRRHHKRRRRRERSEPEPELDEEERAWLEARRAADAKLRLAGEAFRFGAFALLSLVFWRWFVWLAPFVVVVLVLWGARLARTFYRTQIAPGLRERFIEEEVRKRVRDTLFQERRQMEGAHARSMEQLSASIAHEIRNPITAAKSLVQQMGEDPAGRENVEYAQVALEELSRVERSVSHLLKFARDEDFRSGEVAMADLLESALETFRDRLDHEKIRVETSLDCRGLLRGDPEKLRRVAINLVGNAVDALADSGGPDARIEVELGENLAGSEVWIRVRDNGPGMDPETRSRIFEPFFTSKPGGTGLGLPITRKLVEAHGGKIEVQSSPGEGSAFLVTLPKTASSRGESA